jgi:hypothetical protein
MSPAKIGILRVGFTSPGMTGASNALCCGFEPAQDLKIIRSYPLPSPCFALINTSSTYMSSRVRTVLQESEPGPSTRPPNKALHSELRHGTRPEAMASRWLINEGAECLISVHWRGYDAA